MRCPKCTHLEDRVLDSRAARAGAVIRRRRECQRCGYRYTTYEEVLRAKLRVIKRDGRHEDIDHSKLLRGIVRACEKRPISLDTMEGTVDSIIDELEHEFEREVTSEAIGKKVIERLEKLDDVAYVRFASVYRKFHDVNQFLSAIEGLLDRA